MPLTKPYSGASRKLVIGIDFGTTYSGVSYAILYNREVPKILSVTRYPGQEGDKQVGDTKIPTIIYYSKDGQVRAVGAEAENSKLDAEDENWKLAKWFKLHLRPSDLADFLEYLFTCAKDHISQAHLEGPQLVESSSNIEFVLAHPNGWGGSQQSCMREAAVLAGLIPNNQEGEERLHFVTEGEASLHYCIAKELAADIIKAGKRLVIVDAGGGTVDISTYEIVSTAPISAIEATVADCLMQGSTYVNSRAEDFLRKKLNVACRDKSKKSRFGDEEYLDVMMDKFESYTKPTFRETTKSSQIEFTGHREADEKYGIKRGRLTLIQSEMASFFDPSIKAIEDAIKKQVAGAGGTVHMVLLVGGFAASPYLRAKLQTYSQREGLTLICPESQPAKAVAEGALYFHLDDVVAARVAKFHYGSSCAVPWIPFLPDHMMRRAKVGVNAAGIPLVPGGFCIILPKGALVSKDEEFGETFSRTWDQSSEDISCEVIRYKGAREDPCWIDDEPKMFQTLCTIRADASSVPKVKETGRFGPYEVQNFRLVLLFGLTELKAQLAWKEDGGEKRSPAKVIFEDDAK
ncbi:uncharacterized protein LAESUDRAFT_813573 [Laetiporus sulphureus 93-53]|uniref:Actin-like ATPase domain-containing protein n=1 Tax=Laetiporus sulphureus 93-53 TaxID=1314785 RepID=A0A165DRH2_9APHY|nr:uncharacterized protein LAESUDRAFT_813573 [Laetiporus sulphureus 93-53]KZT05474.1 hypothetical protein LAESUDRAFT_813573 [Laetiporus sulphureus 93-53]